MFKAIKNKYLLSIASGMVVMTLILASTATLSIAHADNSSQGSYGSNYDCNGGISGSTSFVPLACYSGATQFSNMFQSGSLSGYINAIFETCLSLGAIAAVVRITYAGWLYMGNDIWGNKQKAKEIISDSVIGLLLLLSIYLILYEIDPNILNLNAIFNSFTTSTSSTTS